MRCAVLCVDRSRSGDRRGIGKRVFIPDEHCKCECVRVSECRWNKINEKHNSSSGWWAAKHHGEQSLKLWLQKLWNEILRENQCWNVSYDVNKNDKRALDEHFAINCWSIEPSVSASFQRVYLSSPDLILKSIICCYMRNIDFLVICGKIISSY